MIDAGEFDIQNFMRTEGISFWLAKEKARRRARADSDMQTAVVRIDADDSLGKAARDVSKRMFLLGVRTDEEREKRLAEFDREMAQREAERARPDLEAAAQAAERRINEQWRPKS
jgi:hypothetical protein